MSRGERVEHLRAASWRTVYEGEIAISASDYTSPVEQGDDYVEVEIPALDERVTSRPVLRFVLDYPFDRPHEGEVVTEHGATLRQIIDAVRAAYRRMYEGATIEPIPGLENKRVNGAYGEAFHAIEDLVIESIEVNEATGELSLFIGS